MRRFRLPVLAFGLLALAIAISLPACRSTVPNRDPLGERFPEVSGEGLDGTVRELPGDLAGASAILLVGYVQDTQFDLDRWLLGRIVSATGNERPRNGRIFLLDAEGRVDWFHDRGYSASKLLELDARVRALHDAGSNVGE